MKISIFGTGYVGLVTGVCFAEMGNSVICADVDSMKISKLKEGNSPIYEPGLDSLLRQNLEAKRIRFTTDLKKAVEDSDILFIAVGTPMGEDGSSDLKYVLQVTDTIGSNMNQSKLVVNKSTVPVGTAQRVKHRIQEHLDKRKLNFAFSVISNPEFLKEGAAISDCLRPSRVIIGCEDFAAKATMIKLYRPFFPKENETIYCMDVASAELTKYAANAMLATKISFMNQISRLCEKVGADIENIRLGIGSDPRIGPQFLYAGIGYGGSCFPKDVRALIKTSEELDFDLSVVRAVEDVNSQQRAFFFKKVLAYFENNIAGKRFAIWGLAFKPGTDDVREAPALYIMQKLLEHGAFVKAYDPVAIESTKAIFGTPENLTYCHEQYDILQDSDALIIVTDWQPFKAPDFSKIGNFLKKKLIFDGRNLYEPDDMNEIGFKYVSIGRNIVG